MAWIQWINNGFTEKLHNKNVSGVSSFSWIACTSVLIWEEIFSRNWFSDWQVIKKTGLCCRPIWVLGPRGHNQSECSQMQRVKPSECGFLPEKQLLWKKKSCNWPKQFCWCPERRISTNTTSHWWDCFSNLILELPIHTSGRITKTGDKQGICF